MILYLMRHGRAGDAPTDVERRLTARGRQDVAAMGRHLAGVRARVSAVFTSPYPRARETAELLAVALGAAPPRIVPELASGAEPDDLLALLRSVRDGRIFMVGHMPDLGAFAAFLAWGQRGRAVNLVPGAVACLRVDHLAPRVEATLEWIVTPEDL